MHEQRNKAMRTLDFRETVSWHSTLVFSRLGHAQWAEFATRNYDLMEPVYNELSKSVLGLISGQTFQRIDNIFNPLLCERSFKGYTYLMIDLARKCSQLCMLWGLTTQQLFILVKKYSSFQSLVRDSCDVIAKAIVTHAMLVQDIGITAFGAFTHLNNVWFAAIASALLSYATTAKAAVVVAKANYDRKVKVVTNPLTKKCRKTRQKAKDCKCKPCVDAVTEYYKSINEAKSALAPNAMNNLKQRCEATAKLNCWNLHFLVPGYDKGVLASNNSLVPCAQLALMPDHFYSNCLKIYRRLGMSAIMRFVNYKATRCFDVNFHDMVNSMLRYPSLDVAVWVNTGYANFGGGIHNIINFFPYEDEKIGKVGYICQMGYDMKKQEIQMSEIMNVNISNRRTAYTSIEADDQVIYYNISAYAVNLHSSKGHCGSPLFSSDDSMTEQRIVGFIVSGDKEKSDSSVTYVAGITRDFLEKIIRDRDIIVYDTTYRDWETLNIS